MLVRIPHIDASMALHTFRLPLKTQAGNGTAWGANGGKSCGAAVGHEPPKGVEQREQGGAGRTYAAGLPAASQAGVHMLE